jgi:hypothetical protein
MGIKIIPVMWVIKAKEIKIEDIRNLFLSRQ